MNPNERRLRADLDSTAFQAGVAANNWEVVSLNWPELTVRVAAKSGHLAVRIDLEGYPAVAPLGLTWDLDTDAPLSQELWPPNVGAQQTFKPGWYSPSINAIYLACDRAALTVHPDWAATYPQRAWNPSRDITFYLSELHRELAATTMPRSNP